VVRIHAALHTAKATPPGNFGIATVASLALQASRERRAAGRQAVRAETPAASSIGASLPSRCSASRPGPSLQPPMDWPSIQMLGIEVRPVSCAQNVGSHRGSTADCVNGTRLS